MKTCVGQDLGPLIAALGLPKYTTRFVLSAQLDEVVTVKCWYYPAIAVQPLVEAFAEYQLVRKSPERAISPAHAEALCDPAN